MKEEFAHQPEENPGAFENALQEIKVARDGRTYPADYRMKAFRSAEKALSRSTLRKGADAAPLSWKERGPGNVSGRTRAIVVDPDDPQKQTWFAASVGGGIWKTTNGGATWQNKTPLLTALSTMTVAMAGSNHNTLYAGTGMGFGRLVDLAGSGVWKSTDRGENWFQLSSTANGQVLLAINRLVIDPQNENVVVLCSNDDYTSFGPNGGERVSGIFKTTDGGTSWTQTFDADAFFGTATDNRVQQIVANPMNFNTLYATVNEVGVIKSTDAGNTWAVSAANFANPADIGFGEGTYQGISTRTEMAISPTDTSRLYAAVERRRGIAKLFMSTNSGATWNEVIDTGSNPNWFSGGGASGAVAYSAGWFDNTIAVHPYDPDIVFVGGVELYRIHVDPSAKTRTTTLIASTGAVHADHHALEIIPINQQSNTFTILNANDGGLAKSTNGGTSWQPIRNMVTTQFYGADKKPGFSQYIGGMQDNGTWFSSDDPTATSPWNFALGGDGVEVAWNFRDPDLMIGGSQYGVYSRSTDGGATWQPVPDAKAGNAPFVSKIASSKIDPDLLFTVGDAGIKRSDDFGASWTLTPINGNWIGYRAFDRVDISLSDPQIVWAASRLDLVSFIGRKGGIHVSTDGGVSFSEVSDKLPATVTESSGWATHPTNPNTAYALFSATGTPKVLRTSDLGQTWEDLSQFDPGSRQSLNGFPDVATFSLLVMPFDTLTIWAGTEIGLFVSSDGGQSWSLADNGVPRVGIFQMKIVDDQILLATYGRGIWTVQLPELQNYPLPSATLSPRLIALAQRPTGELQITANLRSAFDSTIIVMNDQTVAHLGETNGLTDTTILFPVTIAQTVSASIQSFRDGRVYKSSMREASVYPTTIASSYSNNFNSLSSADFTGNFSIQSYPGFGNGAIHSAHPYADQTEYVYQLKIPITVLEDHTTLQYDDVALVEEGIVSSYLDPNFFDFVIVEGTKDGFNWLPLVDGYDARANPSWSSTFNSSFSGINSTATGSSALYVHHQIDLLATFDPGDVIFLRFRLLTDAAAWAWGWAIDNLVINGDIVPPVITLGALATPVLDQVRFGVGADEALSAASVTVNGTDVPLTKYGRLFFGDYGISNTGALNVVANGSDSSQNPGVAVSRTYHVSPLARGLAVNSYTITGQGDGFVVAALHGNVQIPEDFTLAGPAVDVLATGTSGQLSISTPLVGAKTRVRFYELQNQSWKPVQSELKAGRIVATSSGGTLALFESAGFDPLPVTFELMPNYPNPFNPETTIEYSVPNESKITIAVYNILGQKVRTLIDEVRPAGLHRIVWNGKNDRDQSVATGVYLYRLESASTVLTRKMLFLK